MTAVNNKTSSGSFSTTGPHTVFVTVTVTGTATYKCCDGEGGSHSVTLPVNGGPTMFSLPVTVEGITQITTDPANGVVASNDTNNVTFTASTRSSDYQGQIRWKKDGAPVPGATGPVFQTYWDISSPALNGGDRTVTAYIEGHDCTAVPQTVTVVEIADALRPLDIAAICSGSSITFTAYTHPAQEGSVVNWSGGGTPATQTGQLTFTTKWDVCTAGATGTKTVTATVGNTQKTASIVVFKPVGISAGENPICKNANVTFTVTTSPGGYGHLISWLGGGSPATGTGTAFTTSWSGTGWKTVTARCGGDNGCDTQAQFMVAELDRVLVKTVSAHPTEEAFPVGTPVQFEARTGQDDPDTNTYYGEIANWSSTGTPDSLSRNQFYTVTWNTKGAKTVYAGCGGNLKSAAVTIVRLGSRTAMGEVCVNQSTIFTANTDPLGYDALLEWFKDGGEVRTGTGGVYMPSWDTPGMKTVKVQVGPNSSHTFVIAVKSLDTVTPDQEFAFVNEDVTFTANTTPTGYGAQATWSAPGGIPSTGTGETFTTKWSAGGPHTVTATMCSLTRQATVSIGEMDLDVDSDNNGQIQDVDDAIEENSPGVVVGLNGDNDDFATEPEGQKEADNTNSRIDGPEDREDLETLQLAFRPPADVPEGLIKLKKVAGDGKVRVFNDDGGDGTVILGPDASESEDLWDLFENGQLSLVFEGVQVGSVDLELVYTSHEPWPSDKVRIKVVDFDLGADSDNTWEDPSTPSEPDFSAAEATLEDLAPGVAVGLADDDTNDDDTLDRDETTLSADDTNFDARLAKMAKLVLKTTCREAVIKIQYAPDAVLRIWRKNGGSYDFIPNGDELSIPEPPTDYVELFAEGLAVGSDAVTVRACFGDQAEIVKFEDRVVVSVYPVPEVLDFTETFTPGQVEAPPYHVAKLDYRLPDPDSDDAGPSAFQVAILAKKQGDPWDLLFYRYPMDYNADDTHSDTLLYTHLKRYNVHDLYFPQPPPEGGYPDDDGRWLERLCWDGRKDADSDGSIDLDAANKEIWAERGPNIGSVVKYDFVIATVVNKRPLARLVKYRQIDELNSEQVTLEVKTAPLPLQETNGQNEPILGRAPFWRYFRGEINSKHKSLSLAFPSGAIGRGIGPLPAFICYYHSNGWRFTSLGFGRTHNYDIRVLPVWVAGARQAYLLWHGDHLIGPADEQGNLRIFGELANLDDLGAAGWRLETLDQTVYSFTPEGQLQSVEDRNGNTLTVTLADYSADPEIRIKRVGGVTAPAGTVSFSYGGEGLSGVPSLLLSSATLKGTGAAVGRSWSFEYCDADDTYGDPYPAEDPADEVLEKVTGPEYVTTYTYDPGRRANRAARVIPGVLRTQRHERPAGLSAQPTIQVNYGYTLPDGAPEDNTTLHGESMVSSWKLGASSFWRTTGIVGQTATYGDGSSETHTYSGNRIDTVTVSKGGESATYGFGYNDNDNLTNESIQSEPQKSIVRAYYSDGKLHTENPSDTGTTTYDYYPGFYVPSTITAPGGRVTQYSNFDGAGNAQTMTQQASGLPSRTTTFTIGSGGRIDSYVDYKQRTVTCGYNGQGMLLTQQRSDGVWLLSREFDQFGSETKASDANNANPVQAVHDGWDRVIKKIFPDGDFEEWEYTAAGDLVRHVLPKGGAPDHAVETYAHDAEGKPTSKAVSGVDYQGAALPSRTVNLATDGEGQVTGIDFNGAYPRSWTYRSRFWLGRGRAEVNLWRLFRPFVCDRIHHRPGRVFR